MNSLLDNVAVIPLIFLIILGLHGNVLVAERLREVFLVRNYKKLPPTSSRPIAPGSKRDLVLTISNSGSTSG